MLQTLLGLALAVWPAPPDVFRITPQRSVPELVQQARQMSPPTESGSFRRAALIELRTLDPAIRYDIRYATPDNFLGVPVYTSPHAFLQSPAARALARAQRTLRRHGFGLLIHDAYRPWWVTQVFWDATPPRLHEFVADPGQGSRHNRGCAVDLTLYDLATGQPVEMPSLYDEMTERAYPAYAGGTPAARRNRDLLRRTMEAAGFTVYPSEWWHFDYKDWRRYRIGNQDFEQLASP
jgi:zinc D-Ala-D-Ala dipeptidase